MHASLSVDLDQLLTESDAARLLDLSIRTLQRWRIIGVGPKFVRVSARCIRYRRRDLNAWADANLHGGDAA